ncbi:lipid II flippase MurJ [Thermoflavifilum thermophilum]|uniref:Peptidoglycan biosynthesis protein MviN/MurJ, putative lipid II flippase n=1 Tax=Thermoflavifilum thermophilum TaxID=1393122 RepID=A0A1I7MY80_9BACT|nr:lipid II flippase MurJ [Thermoflavifilum thermophilum]SFV27389.1 Peptidoglycan biosynthesis protein MviN/MurJ, putative lipid II flippase [Thermoflavifilum thermophilum]
MKLFFKAEGYKKGVAYSILFSSIAKIIAFLNIALIAYYFGTNGDSDVYYFVLTTIQLISYLISVMESTVIVPELIRLREQEGHFQSMRFVNHFIKIYLIIGSILTIIMLFNPVFVFSHFSGFKSELLLANKYLLYGSPILLLLIILSNLLSEVLSSYMYFTTPMIVNMINSIISILFLIILHRHLGIISALMGLIIGYIVNIVLLLAQLIYVIHWRFDFSKYKLSPLVKKNLFYAHIGNILGFAYNYVGLYLLSFLGTGVVSAMSYGRKLSDVPNHVISGQFSSVLGIKFNNEFARDDKNSLNETFVTGLKVLLFFVIPVSILGFILSDDIISILLRRGEFNFLSVKQSSMFFKYLILCLPFFSINTVMSRLFMAIQRLSFSTIILAVFSVSNIILAYFLIKFYKEYGYPFSYILSYLIMIFSYFYITKKYLKYIGYNEVLIYFIKITCVNILVAFLSYLISFHLFDGKFIRILFLSIIDVISLILLNDIFVLNYDIRFIFRNFLHRIYSSVILK